VQLLFRYVLPRLLFQIFIQKQTIICAIVVQICATTSAFSNFYAKADGHQCNCCSDMCCHVCFFNFHTKADDHMCKYCSGMCYHVCFFKFLYKSRRTSVQLLFRYVLPRLLFQIFIQKQTITSAIVCAKPACSFEFCWIGVF